ncbi:MAG: TIR domain-containing protein [bacterium]|nr:TIR domain-containing protein [bacterium]
MKSDFDVFISYHRRDRSAVERLGRQLESKGLKVWLDIWQLQHEPFGDGCWNQHVQNGKFESGHIRAPIIDDGVCKPAPKSDTLLIEKDPVSLMEGRRGIVIKVFAEKTPGAPILGLA